MPTNFKIPFSEGEQIKQHFSAIDQSYNLANVESSFERAADDMRDILSEEVYERIMTYFNKPPDGDVLNDELLLYLQRAMAPLGLFHHFIWLQLRISNNSITVKKRDDETAAFKYMTDQAKDELLKSSWANINLLIGSLNKNKDDVSEWTDSDQYKDLQELLFQDYKEFEKYYQIDRNAAFFIKMRFIQNEILVDEVIPRFGKISELDDAQLDIKLKRAVSFRMMAMAIQRFDSFWLPTSIRKDITTELRKRSVNSATDKDLKEKVANSLHNQADSYFETADFYFASLNSDDTVTTSPLADFEPNVKETNKYFNAL